MTRNRLAALAATLCVVALAGCVDDRYGRDWDGPRHGPRSWDGPRGGPRSWDGPRGPRNWDGPRGPRNWDGPREYPRHGPPPRPSSEPLDCRGGPATTPSPDCIDRPRPRRFSND
ncbi:hypothetical protein [Aminobacter sp. MDW-2]|uniref:hypothetical protein n=1 Tax=Aminobacter sp. MDW-2 TaxID=2666139 RepID=UPI0012B0A682|nr:hypothetical protein [Aminobacter sp. MDW-2]MRX35735.1 hypothetical protein [Aminobacter sp. MDW-2]QNH36391.1 hypothetical protein H5P29_11150 [Aminobacter sp. MDW-2]